MPVDLQVLVVIGVDLVTIGYGIVQSALWTFTRLTACVPSFSDLFLNLFRCVGLVLC